MDKKTRDFNLLEIMKWMYYNNPGKISINYRTHIIADSLISYVPLKELNLPYGWYFDKKGFLTNKNNSSDGSYCIIRVELRDS